MKFHIDDEVVIDIEGENIGYFADGYFQDAYGNTVAFLDTVEGPRSVSIVVPPESPELPIQPLPPVPEIHPKRLHENFCWSHLSWL